MKLYACGSNAWNQLDFSNSPQPEPRDLHSFQCVLQDEHIEVLKASFSYTLVKTSSGVHLAGIPDAHIEQIQKQPNFSKQLAEAGNGDIAKSALPSNRVIVTASSQLIPSIYDLRSPILQIVGGATFFIALCKNGSIWTWGDERYPACLAREITSETPAHQPALAIDEHLIPQGHFIKIISSPMSYTAAALTSTNDVYLWGMSHAPGSSPVDIGIDDADEGPNRDENSGGFYEESNGDPNDDDSPSTPLPTNRTTSQVFSPAPHRFQLSHEPTPLDLHGLDIQDMAIGDSHMLVLTTDNRLWVFGAGKNGQLGLGGGIKHTGSMWIVIHDMLELEEGRRVAGVVAGPKSSFVMVA